MGQLWLIGEADSEQVIYQYHVVWFLDTPVICEFVYLILHNKPASSRVIE